SLGDRLWVTGQAKSSLRHLHEDHTVEARDVAWYSGAGVPLWSQAWGQDSSESAWWPGCSSEDLLGPSLNERHEAIPQRAHHLQTALTSQTRQKHGGTTAGNTDGYFSQELHAFLPSPTGPAGSCLSTGFTGSGPEESPTQLHSPSDHPSHAVILCETGPARLHMLSFVRAAVVAAEAHRGHEGEQTAA
ncbi:hypothetical protein ATANTOWER_032950, partial [Ataeniobius toweri]|nr:hypothetical protein [Ataeniobius toweri]